LKSWKQNLRRGKIRNNNPTLLRLKETMPSPFENLCGPNKPLKPEPPDAKEFARLVRSGKARLKDASSNASALESRFDLAYNAAHTLCLAALRWHGYRSSNRYIVFQLLPHTLSLGPEVWRVLSKCHDIRNLGEYEGDLNIDGRIVTDLIIACRSVTERVDALFPIKNQMPASGLNIHRRFTLSTYISSQAPLPESSRVSEEFQVKPSLRLALTR
jgi:hypothetical protein